MTALPSLDEIAQLPKTYAATIPSDYLDAMGHMNVMWYTHLFGQGIRGLLEGIGLDQSYIDQHNAGTFALEKHMRYLTEVRVGQDVSVFMRVIARRDSRFHMLQYMTNDSIGRIASTMETVSTHVDLKARRSSPMPSDMADAFDRLVADHGALKWSANLCGVMGL